MQWFRVYGDMIHDPKVQTLRPELFKFLINIWCVTSLQDGNIPTPTSIAYALRMRVDKVERLIKELVHLGLIDLVDGRFEPHNWRKRQYKSDNVYDRVKRFRDKKRNVSETFQLPLQKRPVTVTETVPETEYREEKKEETSSLPKKAARKRAMPTDFTLSEAGKQFARDRGWDAGSIQSEFERFRDHAQANGRTQVDWDASWRGWVTSSFQSKGRINGNGRVQAARSVQQAAHDLHERVSSKLDEWETLFNTPGDGVGESPIRLLPKR